MSPNRAVTAGRGFAAAAALAALTCGLPVLLYRAGGSPVPVTPLSWHHLVTALARPEGSGELTLTIIRDATWIAWAAFALAVAAEGHAQVRGRGCPVVRVTGLQATAAWLVATAALTFTAPATIALASTPAGPAPPAALIADPPTTRPAAALAAYSVPAEVTQAATWTYTVQPGDCLWTIAATYLGSGDEWPQIAQLNLGHTMTGGAVFTDPADIWPGWQLTIPGPGPGAQPPQRPAQHDPPGTGQQDGPVTSPNAHSAHDTARAPYNTTHRAAGSRSDPQNGRAAAAASTGTPASEPRHNTGPGRQHGGPNPRQQPPSQTVPLPAVAGAAAAVLLAAGGTAAVHAMRRRQRQNRRRGRRIPLPADPGARRLEQQLQSGLAGYSHLRADGRLPGPAGDMRAALGLLAAQLRASGQAMPGCIGIHLGPGADTVQLLLTEPSPAPPPPFTRSPGTQDMCWQLDLRTAALPAGDPARLAGLMPGLVTAGTTEDGTLLLDLEAPGITVVCGPAELTDRLTTTMAAELAANQWSGWFNLILAGSFSELHALDRAEHHPTLSAAIASLQARTEGITDRLNAGNGLDAGSIRSRRLARPDDEDYDLTVLVSRQAATDGQVSQLAALAGDGIAVLVPADDSGTAGTAITLTPGAGEDTITADIRLNWLSPHYHITVEAQTLSPADYRSLGDMLDTAARDGDVAASAPPYDSYTGPPWLPYPDILRADGQPQPLPPAGADDDASLRWDGDVDCEGYSVPDWLPDPAVLLDGHEPPASQEMTVPAAAMAQPGGVQPMASTTGGAGPHDTALQIRILGPVEIAGAAESLHDQHQQLLVALALTMPDGLTTGQLGRLLGNSAEHPKPAATIRQIIARTRRRLGDPPGGSAHIRHHDGRYTLSGSTRFDWAEFTALTHADGASQDPAALTTALGLVRGQPLTGCAAWWWIDPALTETIRAEITDTAATAAQMHLAARNAAAARAAARQGLTADPTAEQLTRLLMRAEHAAGNPAGLSTAWAECLEAADRADPGGDLDGQTVALYRELAGAGAAAGQPGGYRPAADS